MAGIPPVLDTDAEDVAWALQTAEALWKRNERVDAIVWLRRAAQAAGEAEEDDRALGLARHAAELSDWLAHNLSSPGIDHPEESPSRAPPSGAPSSGEAVDIDDLLRTSQVDLEEARASEIPVESIEMESVREPEVDAGEERISRVPSAAEKHAGMLDPWAEGEARAERPMNEPSPGSYDFEPEEVVTSAPPVVRPSPKKAPPKPPPQRSAPPPNRSKAPPPAPAPAPAPATATATPTSTATATPTPTPRPPPVSARSSPPRSSKPALPPTAGVDLSSVDSLADLPDDARDAFGRAASVQQLQADEEVSGFALALVLEGDADLAATIVDVPAARLHAGQVLRARGTTDHVTPLRLLGSGAVGARVAVWDEVSVEEAFRSCPWVEDELRTAGDRFQAEVGITIGALGERLDFSLRADFVGRLALRVLAEHEVIATRGKPLPGLLVVGAGELEILGDDDAPGDASVKTGDFAFPSEVLRAAPAPHTLRAGKGGALVLFAERRAAQEILVSCPPLLEIFASG